MKPLHIYAVLIFSFIMISHIGTYAQVDEIPAKPQSYLSIQSGVTMVLSTIDLDNWWFFGYRLFIEYQREIGQNFLVGISYEGMIPLCVEKFEPLVHFLSLNGYYKLNLYKDHIYLVPGLGLGLMHHYGNRKNELGIAVNASLILNIRILKNTYIELSPLVLGPMKAYYSPLNFRRYNLLLAMPFWAFGIRTRL